MDVPSEESNDMVLNHPDIETVEKISQKSQDKKRLEEKRVEKEERALQYALQMEERNKRKLESQLTREELKKQKLEEKRVKKEERAMQYALQVEERNERKLESQQMREHLKKEKLQEKKAAAEEIKAKRKEQALKSMKFLLNVSSKYSDFFKEKLTASKNKSSAAKPLQEKNQLQPTMEDMEEAANAEDLKSEIKAENVLNKLKYFDGGSLRDYQIEGVQWMVNLFDNGMNGILADEMGLGKTVQVIALLAHLFERKIPGPYLISAPLSTLPNWEMEFRRFAPSIPVFVFHGNESERQDICTKIKKKYQVGDYATRPVVLTTYQVPLLEQDFMGKFEWQYIIVDEGHRLKNNNTQLSKILRSLNSTNRLLLTGTPLHNNITELWALLNFLMPQIFNDIDTFASLLMLEDMQDENELIEREEKTNFLSTLHKVMEPFVLRRLKKEVLGDMVPKKELNIYCPLTKLQHDLYNFVIDKNIAMLQRQNEEPPLPPRRRRKPVNYCLPNEEDDFSDCEEALLKIEQEQTNQILKKEHVPYIVRLTMAMPMTMFKKIVDHPYLVNFPLDPNAEGKTLLINEDLIKSSGKLMVLDQVMARLKREGHKVLIFSTLVMSLDLIEEAMIMRGYKYCRLDGGMNLENRKNSIESFNKDPSVFAFLLSTRAGGLGLNLTGADTVIFFDRDWNPQMDIQAQDRCHRIGQTKPVMVYTLVAKNTIDDVIITRGYQKRLLEKIVIKDGKFKTTGSNETTRIEDELRELQQLLKEQATDFDNLTIPKRELDRLLDRSDLWAMINEKENRK